MSPPLSTLEKALDVNLDDSLYGTFAEIGAGQEVVRWFFRAGAAAGTISKSISAYDMKVSDAIYGTCQRYVCRERLEAMLACEQRLNRDRLTETRGDSTRFFSFADTVSARNYLGTNNCHAWMGIRFQSASHGEDNTIIVHVRMLDDTNVLQQEALGLVGVNLIHGALKGDADPLKLVASLLDGLSAQRLEIDMIDFQGPSYAAVDNRVMSLKLVELGLSGAAMFAADGTVLQPSQALRKRSLIIERGRFRPVTHVNMDMLASAIAKFDDVVDDANRDPLPIMEISMHSLSGDGDVCLQDFVSRADVLAATGHTVMISDFPEYYRLMAYLSRYTDRTIGMAMGIGMLRSLFDARHYEHLDGGILESLGRLFKDSLKLFIYPQRVPDSEQLDTLSDIHLDDGLQHLFAYLKERGSIVELANIRQEYLDIHSPQVLEMIGEGKDEWQAMVPDCVAQAIVSRKLFGYRPSP
ncbi:MAG: TonB-dependent receptor [Gammaproteobacteria bacterium]